MLTYFLPKDTKHIAKSFEYPWINLTLKTTLFEVWTAANFSRNSFEVKKKTGQLCLFNFHKPQFLHLGGCEFMSQKVLWWQKKFRSIWTHLQLSAHHNHRGLCVSNHWTLSTWYQKEWWLYSPAPNEIYRSACH